MINLNYFCALLALVLCCLPAAIWTGPVPETCKGDGLYKYDDSKEYVYNYLATTKLWINDVSDEAESNLYLNATALIQRVSPCRYQLRLEDVVLFGTSVSESKSLAAELQKDVAVFNVEPNGALGPLVKFNGQSSEWVRNVKRGVISAFQLRAESDLKSADPLNPSVGDKSSVVYETDLFGKCRTTYKLRNADGKTLIVKKKALHRCSLDHHRESPVQAEEYNSIAEYHNGQPFVEHHSCEAKVVAGVVNEVECKHESTIRVSARGDNGMQAVAKVSLKLTTTRGKGKEYPLDRAAPSSIVHEYTPEENVKTNFDVNAFVTNLCKSTSEGLLDQQYAQNFRDLVASLKTLSRSDLVKLVNDAAAKCKYAGNALTSAVVFTETGASVEAALDLMDKDLFRDPFLVTEFPLLTAVARNRHPSADAISKFKAYLAGKDAKFAYLQKSYLIYSSLIKTYCSKNDCSGKLDDWSSILSSALGSNCADAANKDAVVAALKAIGNVGHVKDTGVLEKCAANKDNSLEVRVAAINAFRRFPCKRIENLDGNYKILQDSNDDAEVRIQAFRSLVKCVNSAKFQTFASKAYSDLLLKEEDYQVVSYIIDFAKERGVTVLLNPILNNPEIRDKLQLNFKEFSWNNYKFRYSVVRDAAVEVDTSVIYTSKTFIPRSVNFNFTLHGYGLRVNALDVTVRMEGLDEMLKGVLVDKLTSEQLVKRLSEKPEQLLDILKALAEKLKYAGEKPYASLSVRVYGSDVFYIQLDSPQKFQLVSSLLKEGKNSLYKERNALRSLQIFNSHIKKPLANGFEFGAEADINLGVFHSRKGERTVKGSRTEFNLKLQNGGSFFLRRHFHVEVNPANRIALKKDVSGAYRFKLDYDGHREDGAVLYNINIQPQEVVQLFILEGKFYKLKENGKWSEVTKFDIPQHTRNLCTSDNFHENVGLDVCFSVQRPSFRRLKEIIKSIRDRENDMDVEEDEDDFDFDTEDDDDDDDDDDNDRPDRPMITLAGPFRYELAVRNTDQLNKFVVSGKTTNTETSKKFEGSLQSFSLNKKASRKLDLTYSRHRTVTSRTYNRGLSLELKVPATNDVRFHFSSLVDYKKHEVLDYKLRIENKILKEVNFNVHFNRKHKTEGQIVSNYQLHAEYDSKLINPQGTYLHLMWTLEGVQESIKSDFYVENRDMKFAQAHLDLVARDPKEFKVRDYDLTFTAESQLGNKAEATGHIGYDAIQSDIDISVTYSSENIPSFPRPLHVHAGHKYDNNAESYVFVDLTTPYSSISHGAKVIFQFSENVRALALEISTPETKAKDSPIKIYYSNKKSDEGLDKDLEFGFKNFNVDLSDRTTKLAELVKKTLGESVLRDFSIEFSVDRDAAARRVDYTFEIEANDISLNTFHVYYFGNLEALRANPDEVPETELGAGVEFKVFEYKGGVKGNIKVANSKSKATRSYYLHVLVNDLLKPVLRLSEAEISSNLAAGKVNFKAVISKEADQYKSFELSADGAQVRGNAEFDVNYSRTLNDGSKKSGKGTIKYTLTDFKNIEATVSVPKALEVKASLVVERKEGHQLHRVKLGLTHSDVPTPVEKNFEVELHKHTENSLNSVELKVEGKNGKPGTLAKEDGLNYLVGFGGKLTKADLPNGQKMIVGYSEYLRYKSAERKFDIDSKSSFGIDATRTLKISSKTTAKFPSLLSEVKTMRFLNRDLNIVIANGGASANINYSAETDSTFFGRLFTYTKFDYEHKLGVSQTKLLGASLKGQYTLGASETNPTPKRKNLSLNLDVAPCAQNCFNSKLTFEHEFGEEQMCGNGVLAINHKREGADANLNLQTGLSLNCGGAEITNTQLHFKRSPGKGANLKRELKITSESQLYEPKKIEWGYLRFNKLDGFARAYVHWDTEYNWEESFEYVRELDEATQKMKAATYKAQMNYKTNYRKSCELNIDKKSNYLNKLECKLNVPSVPKQLAYGYRIFVANPQEVFFGQRHLELSVQLPAGRVLQVEYKGFRATPIDGTDDDTDPNDEREFNGTAVLYWDYAADKKKAVTINLKRDNIAPGHFKFFIEAVNTPLIKTARLELNHKRSFNETDINLGISYHLQNGKQNRLDTRVRMDSDLVENRFSMETNLERPKFNVRYSNEYDKLTGRLNILRIRVAELLTLVVDKEYDPNNRRISLELYNRAGSKYQVDATSSFENDVYTVQGTLKQGGKQLSTLKSVFDSVNTNFNVKLQALATKTQYELNFGLLSESSAVLQLKQDGKFAGVGSVGLVEVPLGTLHLHDVVVSLKWNRFWHKFQEDLLGGADSASASPAVNLPAGYKFNSYLGDIYAELLNDLKPVADSIKETRGLVRGDLQKSLVLQLEFWGSVVPQAEERRQQLIQAATQNKMAPEPETPLYIRLFQRYNALADRLNQCFETVYQSRFRRFAKYIPKLARISYNEDGTQSQFANNVVIRKRTLRAGTLYQLNAEFRNRVRIAGNAILRVKSMLVRNSQGLSLRALYNKYKYRSVRYDFTQVGSVYNRRNIIGFGGESESLHTKARYLLAHDTSKNRFSVVLNYDDANPSILSVYFYGKGPIGISHEKATLDGKAIALPRQINLDNGKQINIGRIHNGICVHVDAEVRVCCYEDSNSCTVAMTRWWTGKVNGLFGKSNNFPQKLKQEDWSLDKIDSRKVHLKPPSEEALKKCYFLFGKHRRTPFRSAFYAIRPNGWRKVCEAALTFDAQKNYCPLLRAFSEHSQLEYVHVDVPSECFKCQNSQLNKSYRIGESVSANEGSEDQLVRGTDFVFVSLPCDKQKFALNYDTLVQRFNKDKSQFNNYYAIKIDNDETSIYQAENGQFVNFDIKAQAPVFQRDTNGEVQEAAFYEAIYYAQALFSRRVASARYLVITSCGNCLPYSARKVRKLSKELSARNIIVSSWGDYNMNLGEDAGDEVAVGYSEDQLYLYTKGSKDINEEAFSAFKVDHEADLCHRLAVRTHGSVFDLKEIRKSHIVEKVPEWFTESREHHTFTVESCELVHNRNYGDFADFKFSKVTHESNDDDDFADN